MIEASTTQRRVKMFAIIKTNGANEIAIHIPHHGAEKTLPALAAMLEQNATFINRGYYEASVVNPEMQIVLGNTYIVDSEKPTIEIAVSGSVIGEDFVTDTPEVRVSFKKVIESKDKEIERLRTELSMAKMERDRLQDSINAMSSDE